MAMDWTDELAAALDADAPSAGETDDLLHVARDVAHTVERKITPIATFLLGMSVQRRISEGVARGEAIANAIAALRATLPAENADGGGE